MTNKYTILKNKSIEHEGRTLYRIQALKDFGNVKAGDLGGWVEKESNLSQEGLCWIYDEGKVFGNAKVFENAWVYDNAQVSGYAEAYGDAEVFGNAQVSEHAEVSGKAWVYGDAEVFGDTEVFGDAKLKSGEYIEGIYTGEEGEVEGEVEESLDIISKINKVLSK